MRNFSQYILTGVAFSAILRTVKRVGPTIKAVYVHIRCSLVCDFRTKVQHVLVWASLKIKLRPVEINFINY